MINNLGEKENHVGCVGISFRGNKTVNGWKALDYVVNIDLDDFDGNVTILFLSLTETNIAPFKFWRLGDFSFRDGITVELCELAVVCCSKYKAFAPKVRVQSSKKFQKVLVD